MPSKEKLWEYIQSSPDPVDKREIAHHFGITGQDRTKLRILLRELMDQGVVMQNPAKAYGPPNMLPDSAMIEILGPDRNGELLARPVEWHGKGRMPNIYVFDKKADRNALKPGDRVLARLKKTGPHDYDAKVLKARADDLTAEAPVIGIFKKYKDGGFVSPTDKKVKEDFLIPPDYMGDAQDGDLVSILPLPNPPRFLRNKNPSRVVEVLGDATDPKLISLIAIHSQGIPTHFKKEVLDEAESFEEPQLEDKREDLRQVPLVTIDGGDARDFDDAVYATPDTDPKNPGGWKIIVAIADVSYYVRPFSALDRSAFERGNSTYFADRVVPMLPERLSNDLCSLRPHVPRACLAAHMVIDKDTKLIDWRFARGLMRSAARLTYEQVQAAQDGQPDDTTGPLLDPVIKPLYKAYSVMKHARDKRGALDLNLPERKAIIENGIVKAIVPRTRLASHMLIEEFMILANVAAAQELERKHMPGLYRVHDKPSFERLEAAREALNDMDYSLPKTDHIHPKSINHLLHLATERGEEDFVHTLILRTQSQATYSPDNIGHFGLALEKYAHFTSPIRRYADLIVHRALVKTDKLGPGGLSEDEEKNLFAIAEHIAITERRSMIAERDVMDRFTAQYLAAHVGENFNGKVSSVTHFGIFVALTESGADGIVPMRYLPNDYYVHDEQRHRLIGKNTGRTFRMGDPIVVRLVEADPLRASTVFEVVVGGITDEKPQRHHRGNRHYKDKKSFDDKNGKKRRDDRGGKKRSGKTRNDKPRDDKPGGGGSGGKARKFKSKRR